MIVHFGQEVHSVQSVQVIKFWWTRFPLILRRNRISGPILISLLSTSRSEFQSSLYSAHACILGKVSNTVGRILFVIAEWIFLAENICWILGPQSPTPLGYQHSCYMYTFVLGSLAMRGTLTLIKFPAAEDEGKCHDRKVAEMKLSFRPNWQEGRPQLAGGQRKLVWHCIALHCYFVPQEKSSQADKGCKIWSQKRFFKDGCLNPIKEVLWLLFTCMALHRHLSKRKDTIWCWRLFLSETCIGFTMHNVTAPALHVKCLSCTLSRSALGASLCIDVFLLQKSISAKQYLTASLWVSTKNYVRIMSGKFVLYHPIWIAFEIAFLKGSSNFKCFLTVHTTEFVT